MIHAIHRYSQFHGLSVDGIGIILNGWGDALNSCLVDVDCLGLSEVSELASDSAKLACHCKKASLFRVLLNTTLANSREWFEELRVLISPDINLPDVADLDFTWIASSENRLLIESKFVRSFSPWIVFIACERN